MNLAREIVTMTNYAVVDFAQEAGAASTSAPQLRKAAWERGACWLAIGLLRGTSYRLSEVTFVMKNAGTFWQPIPILWSSVYYFIGYIGLVGVVMTQAHRDRRPNVLKLYVLVYSSFWLGEFGDCSPYPLISALGAVLSFIVCVPGMYILVMKIDKDTEQEDVQNGCKPFVAFMLPATLMCTLMVASLTFGPYFVSGLLMLLQMAFLKVCIPLFKKRFGDDGGGGATLYPQCCSLSSSGPVCCFSARISKP